MRVGIATATAMAHALRIPVIDVVSLDLLAFPMRYSDRIIAAVIDARRSEVYYSLYRQVPGGVQRISEAAVGTPDELIADLLARSDDVLCVGNGALRHRDQISDSVPHAAFADQWLGHPSAAPLVQLAHARALREDWKNHWELAPMYLRKPDAQINWSTRRSAP
jgi:tRNA threonylcarbamoyladenosine biosynthesis protein TsaB